MHRIASIFVLTIMLCAALGSAQNVRPADNEECAGMLITKKIESLLSEYMPQGTKSVIVIPPAQNSEIDIFMNNVILSYLHGKQYTVHETAAAVGITGESVILGITAEQISIKYNSIDKTNAERSVFAKFGIILFYGTKKRLLFAGEMEDTGTDIILKKDISRIEQNRYGFLKGRYTYSSKWKKYFEPVLISSVAAGIIYSLFHFRSK